MFTVLQGIKSIAVIGAGKIGSAMIRAIRSCFSDITVYATGRRDETLKSAAALGSIALRDNRKAVSSADLVILSVKPHHFPQVVNQAGRDVWEGKIVVSVMAGIRLKTLRDALKGAKVFRAMPNINALVRHSTTAIAIVEDADDREKSVVDSLFKCLGTVYWVPEEFLDVWTGLIGSGPAFLAEIIDALVLGAVASGMYRELAYNAILDVLEGTAILLKNRTIHPAEMRDEVTTPAGTTIRGLMVLESEGVKAALMKTVEAASKRSSEIGSEIDRAIRRALGLD